MAQSGFTPIQLYFSTTGAAVPSAGNLANGELAINITDGRLFYKDNSGTVQVLATKAGANGDVVGPASATDNALVRFDNISGKLVQNSVGILDDSGNLSGIAALTTSGALTLNGGTANGVAYLNGSKVLTTGSALTYNGTTLTADTSSTSAANLRIENGSFNRVGAFQLTANGVQFDAFDQNSTSAQRSFMWLSGGSEQMRLTSTGLGIGTSSPGYKLDVIQDANSFTGARIRNNDTGSSAYAGLILNANGNTWAMRMGSGAANSNALQLVADQLGTPTVRATLDVAGNLGLGVTPSASQASGVLFLKNNGQIAFSGPTSYFDTNVVYNNNADRYIANGTASRIAQLGGSFQFLTAPSGTAGNAISFTQAMTLDADGDLGIGTTSPSEKLDVYVNSTANISAKVGNTSGSIQLLQSNGIAYLYTAANQPIAFSTNNTERARIDSSGNLLVGATSSIATGSNTTTGSQIAPSYTWFANQDASYFQRLGSDGTVQRFLRGASQVGSISVTSTTTTYNTSSDYRLKEDIQPMTGALAFVRKQRPVKYRWKADGSEGSGYIAHWMQEDGAGQCVTGEKDAVDAEGKPVYQGIDTSFMVGPLNAAIKELADIVDAQAAIITALTARVAALESN